MSPAEYGRDLALAEPPVSAEVVEAAARIIASLTDTEEVAA